MQVRPGRGGRGWWRLWAAWALALHAVGAPGAWAASSNVQLAEPQGEVAIRWAGMSRPAPLPPLDHVAMLVPVEIKGLPGKQLFLQFDLGTPTTVLYTPKWKSIAERVPALAVADGKPGDFSFTLGSMAVALKGPQLMARNMPGIDWDSPDEQIIGTLGADVIDGRVVLIDLVQDKIVFARDRAAVSGAGTPFFPFEFSGRRILLSARFEGQDVRIMYDSGSSAFAWLTSETHFRRLARPGAVAETYTVGSWGNRLTAHTIATDATTEIGGQQVPLKEVSYISDMGLMQQAGIRAMGVGGMVGNRLFLGKRLIIDTTKLEYAVESPQP